MIGLPDEGELQVGAVSLPAGKFAYEEDGGTPIAWVTLDEVPEPGRVWAALSAEAPRSGLVPFMLGHLRGEPSRPWDSGEFWDVADPARIEAFDVAALLEDRWDSESHEYIGDGDGGYYYPVAPERARRLGTAGDTDNEDPEFVAHIEATTAPFGRQFPGLAPPVDEPIDPDELNELLGAFPARRIGLVPAARPADVLPLIGWPGGANHFADALPIAAVARSWEDRFGARVLEIGFADLSLLAYRPPRTAEQAQRIAAEHWAFCDECGTGLTDIPAITAQLLSSPIWSFWWD